ncbi:MAG: branched-chain amino acid aminotransferase, partial [Bacillota bacterium]|nr:branched-chain amino acid aminotransferase [Bacillota bacterium]
LRIEKDWVPWSHGTSLYIRPTMIATDTALGVRPSDKYLFFIILSPVGAYYAEGLKPVSILVEEEYVRAVPGGTGSIKCAGNYAASLITGQKAHDCGCVQALWLDGVHRKYVEEVGSMNIFFKIGGRLVTPAVTGSILPGITRDSVMRLARDMGIAVEERQIEVGELFHASEDGMLEEVFGTGTAAVISGVSELVLGQKRIVVNDGKLGALSAKLYELLTGIQYGALPDKYGWVERV